MDLQGHFSLSLWDSRTTYKRTLFKKWPYLKTDIARGAKTLIFSAYRFFFSKIEITMSPFQSLGNVFASNNRDELYFRQTSVFGKASLHLLIERFEVFLQKNCLPSIFETFQFQLRQFATLHCFFLLRIYSQCIFSMP